MHLNIGIKMKPWNSFSYGEKVLIKGADVNLVYGRRYKTSLLLLRFNVYNEILADMVSLDEMVWVRPRC